MSDPYTTAGKNIVGGAVKGNINVAIAAAKGAEQTTPGKLYELIDRLGVAIIEAIKGGDIKKAETLAENLEKAKKTIEEKTGLPVEQPTSKATSDRLYHAFGEGLTPTPGSGAVGMALGGAANAIGEYATPDNPLGRFLISVGVPMAANIAGRAIGSAVTAKMATNQGLKNVPKTRYNLTKSEITGDPADASAEAVLKGNEKTAARYKEWETTRGTAVKEDLERFTRDLVGPKRNSADAGRKAAVAFENYREGLLANFKATNKRNFDKALNELGGERIIDVTKVREAIEEKIRKYDGMMADPVSARKAEALKKMYSNMFMQENAWDMAGQPYKATLREVQNALENYGQVAYGKGGIFTDIAPGSDIGDAKFIAQAWQDSLDDAAKSLSGADQKAIKALVDARRSFAVGVKRLNNVATSPIMGVIEKTNLVTNPEKVYEQFQKMSPAERAFYGKTMADKPEILNIMRRSYFDSMADSGNIMGHGAKSPSFDPRSVVTKFDEISAKDPEFIKFLFPDNKDRLAFSSRLKEMRKMAETGVATIPQTGTDMILAGGAAAVVGHPGTAMTVRGVERFVKDAFTDKEVLFDTLILGKKPQSGGRLGVAASNALSTGFGINRTQAGAAFAGQNPEQQPSYQEGIDAVKAVPGVINSVVDAGTQVFTPEPVDIENDPILQDEPVDLENDPLLKDEEAGPFDDAFMDRVKAVESGGDPLAISPAGAMGPYQFNPITQKEMKIEDPFDENETRRASREYLNKLYARFGDKRAAVAAYNMGPTAYQQYLEGKRSMPKETQDYLKKVLQ